MDGKFEAKLVVQALRINTLSKLTFSDCARFNALMKDVFPGIEFKDIEYEELAEAIRSVCEEANLRVNEIQVYSQGKGQRNSNKVKPRVKGILVRSSWSSSKSEEMSI